MKNIIKMVNIFYILSLLMLIKIETFGALENEEPTTVFPTTITTFMCNTSPDDPIDDPAQSITEMPQLVDDNKCQNPNVRYYPDKDQCQKYFYCHGGKPFMNMCPDGKIWDIRLNICNWPVDAQRPECNER